MPASSAPAWRPPDALEHAPADLRGARLPRAGLDERAAWAAALLLQHLGDAVSIERVARASGLSLRSLYRQIRRTHGTSPAALRRRARMASARRDLQRPRGDTTVTVVALRWGFAHLGRFSLEYARAFGESPSATLRAARRASPTSLTASPDTVQEWTLHS